MPGMAITFILITFPPSPCCQLLFSYLTTRNLSPSCALVHTVTMSLPTVFLTLLVCFNTSFSSSLSAHPNSAKKSGCFKVNNCKCIMKDGSGVINLNAMGDAEGFLGRLKPVSAENMPVSEEILMSFSPCQPFSQPEDQMGTDCTNVAACLIIRYIHTIWPCSYSDFFSLFIEAKYVLLPLSISVTVGIVTLTPSTHSLTTIAIQ